MRYNGRNGKYNYSLDFNGSSNNVQVSDNSILRFDNSSEDFSLFAWVKRSAIGATHYVLSKEDADNDGWRLLINSDNTFTCSVDAIDITSTKTVDTNWHLVGCTIDRDGVGKTYIDAVEAGPATAISSEVMSNTANLQIGTRSYSAASYFDGPIDDVKIFNYPLTPYQVQVLYNQNSAVQYAPISGAP